MPFDAKKFLKTKYVPRTDGVAVPDLRDFFPEGEPPVWTVRGLTGQEMGRAAEAAERNKSMAAIVEGLSGDSSKEKTEAMKELLGVGGNAPADIVKRMEYLVLGSVDPKCPLDLAVRLCEVYPVEFYQITQKVLELTGLGQLPGKPKPSGETEGSVPPSLSVSTEGDSSMK